MEGCRARAGEETQCSKLPVPQSKDSAEPIQAHTGSRRDGAQLTRRALQNHPVYHLLPIVVQFKSRNGMLTMAAKTSSLVSPNNIALPMTNEKQPAWPTCSRLHQGSPARLRRKTASSKKCTLAVLGDTHVLPLFYIHVEEIQTPQQDGDGLG